MGTGKKILKRWWNVNSYICNRIFNLSENAIMTKKQATKELMQAAMKFDIAHAGEPTTAKHALVFRFLNDNGFFDLVKEDTK